MQDFTILVVDDDPAILSMLEELLSNKGDYRLLLAGDSKEAVATFCSEPRIDVVLTDIHMPDYTGIEMVNDMKTLDFKPEILVMTANGNPENVEKSRKIGARSMILKPFDNLDVIEAEIDKAIAAAAEKRVAEDTPEETTVTVEGDADEVDQAPMFELADDPTEAPGVEQQEALAIGVADESAEGPQILPGETSQIDPPAHPPAAAPRIVRDAFGNRRHVHGDGEDDAPPFEEDPTLPDPVPTAPPPFQASPPPAPTVATAHTAQPTQTPSHTPAPPKEPIEEPPTPEEPKVTLEELASHVPEELAGIFKLSMDLDAEGLKLQVPIVCLQTQEEPRAVAVLKRLSRKLRRRFYTWSATKGMLDVSEKPVGQTGLRLRARGILGVFQALRDRLEQWFPALRRGSDGPSYLEPTAALEFIAEQDRDSLFVLADFSRFLDDPRIARSLHEMVMERHVGKAMIVLTAPHLQVPAELEGSCAMFEWPQSDEQEVKAVFDEVRKAMEVTVGAAIDLDGDVREEILGRLTGLPADRVRFEIARELMKVTS